MESTKYPAADTEAPRRWAWRWGQRKVGRWLIQLSQVAERVPSRSYPALPAASGEFCKENPFSRIKLKQREAKKALKIRCTGEIGEIFQRITRPAVNSPTLRKKVEETVQTWQKSQGSQSEKLCTSSSANDVPKWYTNSDNLSYIQIVNDFWGNKQKTWQSEKKVIAKVKVWWRVSQGPMGVREFSEGKSEWDGSCAWKLVRSIQGQKNKATPESLRHD